MREKFSSGMKNPRQTNKQTNKQKVLVYRKSKSNLCLHKSHNKVFTSHEITIVQVTIKTLYKSQNKIL